jgi:hypothetical protein
VVDQLKSLLIWLVVWSLILTFSITYLPSFEAYLNGRAFAAGCFISVVSLGIAALAFVRSAQSNSTSIVFGLLVAAKPVLFAGAFLVFFGEDSKSIVSAVLGLTVIFPAAVSSHLFSAKKSEQTRRLKAKR